MAELHANPGRLVHELQEARVSHAAFWSPSLDPTKGMVVGCSDTPKELTQGLKGIVLFWGGIL